MADAVVQAVATEETFVQPWPLSSRILFRFVCCYWLLYALLEGGRVSIVYNIPGTQFLAQPYTRMRHVVVPWVAIHWRRIVIRSSLRKVSGDNNQPASAQSTPAALW
jgi:hypothetical protein